MPKTYDKKAWLEQKELTKEENLKIIQNIVNNFKEDPEKILEFIDFQSRFYNYSTRNTMLIYAQNPGALFVGSFAAIKKITDELAKEHKLPNGELPYYGIKKGAKAIKIFVPQKITYLKNESGDWIQLSKADKQMQLEYKKGNIESYQRLGFGIGSVFDISQTNLPIELYPTVISEGFGEESEIHKQFAEYITDFCKQHNIEVKDMNEETVTIRGLARNDNIIELNPLLNDTGRLSTLLHEVGHELLHFSANSNKMSIEQKEIEADIFSMLMLRSSYFGLIGNAMSDVLINQSWSDINKYVDSALNDVNNTINGEIKETTYSFMPDFSINLSKAVLQQTLEKNNASTILLYDSSDIEKYDKLADEAVTMLKAVKSQSDLNKIFPDKKYKYTDLENDTAFSLNDKNNFKEETKEMIQTLVRKGLPDYNYIVTEKTIDNKNYKTQVLTVKSGENTDTVKYTVSGAGDIYLPLFIAMYHAKNGVYVKDMLKNSVSDLTSDIAENTESSGIADYNDFIATVRLANIDLFGAAEIGRAVTNAISNGAIGITHKITSYGNNRNLTLTLIMPSQKEWEEMFGVSEKEDIVTDNLKVIETMLEKAGITDLYFPVAATVKSALFTYFEGFFNLPVNSSELENRVILTSLNAEQFFHHNGLYTAYDGGVTLSLKASEIPVRIDILPSADEVIQDAFIYDVYNSEEHNIIKSTPNYTYNCSAVEIAYIIDVDAFKEQYGFEFPTIVMTNGNTFKAGDTITMLVEYSCMERIAISEEDIGHSLRDIFGNSQMIIGYSHSGTHSKEKDEGFDSTGWYHTFGSEKNVYHLGIKAAFVDGEVVRQEYQKPHTYNGLSVKNTGAKVNPLLWFKAFRTAA